LRILIRTSKWATWSRRLGGFAPPLIVISVWMHRNQMLNTETFLSILAIALIFASLAVITGLGAYIRLWQSGDRGWGRATTGLVLGLISLSPLVYATAFAMKYPFTADVSTQSAPPLQLLIKSDQGPVTSGELQTAIKTAFPLAVSRSYQIDPVTMFEILQNLVAARGWEIRIRRAPTNAGQDGQINALAMTFIGFRDEIVLRVSQKGEGSIVAMRSTSLVGEHDLGRNGTRIEAFLEELDTKVAQGNDGGNALSDTN